MAISTSLKSAAPAVLAAFRALRRELARRGASRSAAPFQDLLEATLDEALGVLAQDDANLVKAVQQGVKGLISRPAVLKHPAATAWLRTEMTQRALKDAILALLHGQSDDVAASKALDHYASFESEDAALPAPAGAEVYAAALDYVRRSIERDLSLGEVILLDAIGSLRNDVLAARGGDASEILDLHLASELRKLRQRRFFGSASTRASVSALAALIIDGRLMGASAAAKAEALAWCARLVAHQESDSASEYVEVAQALTNQRTSALRIAEAFLRANTRWQAGLAMLDIDAAPIEATAAFQIVFHGLGAQEALDHAQRAAIEFDKMDADGRYAFITASIQSDAWRNARDAVDHLLDEDFAANPALLWLAAAVLVAATLPEDLRGVVLQNIPPNPAWFPLADTPQALADRARARDYLERVAIACDRLDLAGEAANARRYGLWLTLRDPATRGEAMALLPSRLADPTTMLAYLPLAITAGLEVDFHAAERLIDMHLARASSQTADLANAALAMIFASGSQPTRAADLLQKYKELLEPQLEPQSLLNLQVRILVDAGKVKEARTLLAAQPVELLSEHDRALLDQQIAGTPHARSIETLEQAYARDPQVRTLLELVHRHRERGFSERYVELARELLSQLPSVAEAERLLDELVEQARDEQAVEILDLIGAIVEQSDELMADAAWIRYRTGSVVEAERLLSLLEARRSDQRDRALRFQLLVATGRWREIDSFLEDQWQARVTRDARELAQCATLSAQLGSRRTAEFIELAVARGESDAEVLVAAYNAATNAGLEERLPGASAWIMRAAELSGEDGPVKMQSIEVLIEGQPAWEKQVADANQALATAEIPLEIGGQLMRRPWLELQLSPLLANPLEPDARRHALVPLFSGGRPIERTPLALPASIAIDRTAIVTLAFLDLLEPVLAQFDEVLISHAALSDLFEQRHRLAFHQPSKIDFAHRLADLISKGKVAPLKPMVLPDVALVAEVGRSLATLLEEAAAPPDGQHLVVHGFPINRVGTLMSQAADLARYETHLCSCSAVLDWLERGGRLTRGELDHARRYFESHDMRWPDEPIIERGATLYLSDLAVEYLRYAGLLDALAASGVTIYVAPSELEEASGLRAIEALADRASACVDRARAVLAAGLERGTVRLDGALAAREDRSAMLAVASLARRSELILCDDRFFNRYEHFDHESGRTRIASTVDLLEALVACDAIPRTQLDDALSRLRLGGAVFVALDGDGLAALVGNAKIVGDELVETAELRGLRENIRLAQLRGWFNVQSDIGWLLRLSQAIADALLTQWREELADDVARARSNWLVKLLGASDWSELIAQRPAPDWIANGRALDLTRLATASVRLDAPAAARFADWLETDVVTPLFEEAPRLKPIFLANLRSMVITLSDELAIEHPELDAKTRAQHAMLGIPWFLQRELLLDAGFREALDITVRPQLTIGPIGFDRSEIFAAISELYGDAGASVEVRDATGEAWQLSAVAEEGWSVQLRRGEDAYRIAGIAGLHPQAEVRLAMLETHARDHELPLAMLAQWRDRLAAAPLDPAAIEALEGDLELFPTPMLDQIGSRLAENEATIPMIVPPERVYYERLCGAGIAPSLEAYLALVLPGHVADLQSLEPLARARQLLSLASQPLILSGAGFDLLSDEQWLELADWVITEGDLLALTGFFELALGAIARVPALEETMCQIAALIDALDPDDDNGRLALLSSLAILVDGELSRQHALADWPPYRRRIATLAQAALVERIMLGADDFEEFSRFCLEQRGWQFMVQNFVDLRLEPRWRPAYLSPDQLKHELIGRIVNAASAAPALPPALHRAVLDETDSVKSRMTFPNAFFPGPIEGGLADRRAPPAALEAALRDALAGDELTSEAISLLVNLETLFQLPEALVDRAIELIRGSSGKLLAKIPVEHAGAHLRAIAYLAAGHRRADLSDQLRMLARLQRTRSIEIAITDEVQLALVAVAAHADLEAWRAALGEWLRELANQPLTPDAAQSLLNWLETLLEIDPLLGATLGRALAATRLVLKR